MFRNKKLFFLIQLICISVFLYGNNRLCNDSFSYQDSTEDIHYYKPDFYALRKIKQGVSVWNEWIRKKRKRVLILNNQLWGGRLDKFNLENLEFSRLSLNNTSFKYSRLKNCNFQSAEISGSSFLYADLRTSSFYNAKIAYVNFSNANLKDIKFKSKYIAGCYFIRANLENADFSTTWFSDGTMNGPRGNSFEGANLRGANLSNRPSEGIPLRFTKCNMENVNFRNSDLHRFDFICAYIKGADFTGANMAGVKIEKKWMRYLEKFKSTIKNWDKINWVENEKNFNPTLNNALVISAKNGNYEECIKLLKAGADTNAFIDGVPALTWACFKGHTRVAELLLNNNADVNILDKDIDTPLIAAVFANKPEIVKLLLSRSNVKVNFNNFTNKTALDIALEKGYTEIIQLLKAKNAQDTGKWRLNQLLLTACNKGNLEAIKAALEKGADVNGRDVYGRTAFMIASYWGYLEIAEFLILKGANIHSKDALKENALMDAAYLGNLIIVKYLVGKGIKINEANKYSKTAFLISVEQNHIEVVRYFADMGLSEKEKIEGLVFASKNGHFNIVKLLVNIGANVNLKNKSGKTALMEAAFKGHIVIVRFLISKGANVNERDGTEYQSTPLFYAVIGGSLDVIHLLVSNGANIHIKNSRGGTLYATALYYGRTKIATYLRSIITPSRIER